MDFSEAQRIAAECATSSYYMDHYRDMERMYLPALFSTVRKLSPRRVVEVGPGWGTTAVWLADRGHDVTVIDHQPLNTWITEEMVDVFGFRYVHHDIEDAAQPEGVDLGTFDLIIMTQVIHHLAWRPDRALRHVASLMTRESEAIFSVLDRKKYPAHDAAFGDDWHSVPEWGSADKSTEVVKCMYTKPSFAELLESQFGTVKVWRPFRSKVLFARCSL